MQTPIRVVHKRSPIVRFVNEEEMKDRPKGIFYPKPAPDSPPKLKKPNPVDEGSGVSVAPLTRVKWNPPRMLKRGEQADTIVFSNPGYQERFIKQLLFVHCRLNFWWNREKRSPGQGLRKVSGKQIVRFLKKEKINSEVVLNNSTPTPTDKNEEEETENWLI